MANFALLEVGGFVAPRHVAAIRDTGNRLIAACDPYDSVGVMDNYFPDAAFFTEVERSIAFSRRVVAGSGAGCTIREHLLAELPARRPR